MKKLALMLPLVILGFKFTTKKITETIIKNPKTIITTLVSTCIVSNIQSQTMDTVWMDARYKAITYTPVITAFGFNNVIDGSTPVPAARPDYRFDIDYTPYFQPICLTADFNDLVNQPTIPTPGIGIWDNNHNWNVDYLVTMRKSTADSALAAMSSSISANNFNLSSKQNSLNGTGYIKISGSTISYDNSSFYLNSNPNGYISSIPTQSFSTIAGKPTSLSGYGITDAYPLVGNPSGFITSVPAQSFSSLTGKPTTLSGYGITDGVTSTAVSTSLTTKFNNPSGTTSQYIRGDGSLATTVLAVTQTLTGNNGIIISSGANTFTVSKTKRQETYSGTTDGSGNYTITFATAYSVAPNIQTSYIGGTALYRSIVTVSTTGFTVNIVSQNTNSLLGIVSLVSSTSNVSGASVDVLITEK